MGDTFGSVINFRDLYIDRDAYEGGLIGRQLSPGFKGAL